MLYAKLMGGFHHNSKILQLKSLGSDRFCKAITLFVMSLSHCAGELTDGVISEPIMAQLVPFRIKRPLRDLEAVGLLKATRGALDGHWEVNDYTSYNISKAQLTASREASSARKKRSRARNHSVNRDVSRVTHADVTRPRDAGRHHYLSKSKSNSKGVVGRAGAQGGTTPTELSKEELDAVSLQARIAYTRADNERGGLYMGNSPSFAELGLYAWKASQQQDGLDPGAIVEDWAARWMDSRTSPQRDPRWLLEWVERGAASKKPTPKPLNRTPTVEEEQAAYDAFMARPEAQVQKR